MVLLPHLITQRINNLTNVRKGPTNFIILHGCTKNHTDMTYSYQEMMRTSVPAPLCPFHLFWPKKSSFHTSVLKTTIRWYLICKIWCRYHYKSFWAIWAQKIFLKKKKTPGNIIILHLHPKNHNHLMYSSLKMMPTALQGILGQFLPFYSIFRPRSKFSKNGKILKTH